MRPSTRSTWRAAGDSDMITDALSDWWPVLADQHLQLSSKQALPILGVGNKDTRRPVSGLFHSLGMRQL